MITLQKKPGKDFVILNLTDPQMKNTEWEDTHPYRSILSYTLSELIRKAQPDLITVSGDLAWAGDDPAYDHIAGDDPAYDHIAALLDSFGIPWAPVWGNHDHEYGGKYIDGIADRYLTHPLCMYEKGDPILGNGNYVIRVEEDGRLISSVFMMDSHNGVSYKAEAGRTHPDWSLKTTWAYAKLTDEQLDWYREQVLLLRKEGCLDNVLILHIPPFIYHTASEAAFRPSVNLSEISYAESLGTDIWNPGYEEACGVQHEHICSYPEDDGVFAAIKELDFTKCIVAGHDHRNNTIIPYEGVHLVYGTKTGAGCYWEPGLNGGTVIRINSNGIGKIYHELVDVSHLC